MIHHKIEQRGYPALQVGGGLEGQLHLVPGQRQVVHIGEGDGEGVLLVVILLIPEGHAALHHHQGGGLGFQRLLDIGVGGPQGLLLGGENVALHPRLLPQLQGAERGVGVAGAEEHHLELIGLLVVEAGDLVGHVPGPGQGFSGQDALEGDQDQPKQEQKGQGGAEKFSCLVHLSAS